MTRATLESCIYMDLEYTRMLITVSKTTSCIIIGNVSFLIWNRQAAWNARFLLKGSCHAVSEDLPLSTRIQRAKQRQEKHRQNDTTPIQQSLAEDPSPNPRPVFSPRRKTTTTQKLHPVFAMKTVTMRTKMKAKGKKKGT